MRAIRRLRPNGFVRSHLWLILGALTLLIAPRTAAQSTTIGNQAYDTAFTVLSRIDARNGAPRPHSSAVTVDGRLVVVYAEESDQPRGGIAVYDMSDPTQPRKVGGTEENTGLLAEQHAIGFHRDGDTLYAALLAVGGIEIWDWSDVRRPTRISRLELPGVHLGYALGAWWLFWQAPYIYVSGASNGLFIVDAADPRRPHLVSRDNGPNPLPVSQTGGFRIGPVFAVGNLLVLSANDGSGYATLDISDPRNPALLDAMREDAPPSYSSMVNGSRIYAAGTDARLHIFDISDPAAITHVGAAEMDGRGGYLTVQDGFAHVGASEHYAKIDVRDERNPRLVGTASSGLGNRDEDFAVVHGNLVTIGDDHGNGTTIVAHSTAPDTTGPRVTMVSPADGALEQARSSRIGLTFSDQIDLRSITPDTLIVRKVGGDRVSGRVSGQTGIVNFWPDAPLDPDAIYEIILPAGGVRDVVGNPLAADFRATFSTGQFLDAPVRCRIVPPELALVDQPVDLRVDVTSDVGQAEHIWTFGDGSEPTIPLGVASVRHTYRAPGHYTVRTVVGNARFRTACATQVTAIHPVVPGHPTATSTILFDADRARVWNVNPDNDSVTITSAVDHGKLAEVRVGAHPRTLAQAPDGTVWVVNQDDASISVLAPEDGRTVGAIPLPPASQPYGIIFTPDRRHAFVSLEATGKVLRLDPTSRAVTGETDVGPTPRGLAASHVERRVFVVRHISPDTGGQVIEFHPETLDVTRVHTLALDPGPDTEASGRGLPNGLGSPAVTPDGRRLWVPAKKDNIQRGLQRDGLALTFESTVRPMVGQIDLVHNRELLDTRIDFNDREGPTAVLFSPYGDYAFVLLQGSNAVEVVDVFSGEVVTAIEDVGAAPAGMALTADSSTLFVHGWLSRTLRAYDVKEMIRSGGDRTAELLAVVDVVAQEALPADVLRGKQIFYHAGDKRMSRDGYIACASCHPDGGHDGRVWDRTAEGEGLRNTIDLRTPEAGRLHWSANFDEIQDFEYDVRALFGGHGFLDDPLWQDPAVAAPLGRAKAGLSADLDALAAFVTSLRHTPSSPYRMADGALTAQGEAGKRIFRRLGCGTCHGGPAWSDSAQGMSHDLGTLSAASGQRLGGVISGIDTPTLTGLWASAPYLHDGSAADLPTALLLADGAGWHGDVDQLSSDELDALLAYLHQIDGREAAAPVTLAVAMVRPEHNAVMPRNQPVTLVVSTASGLGAVADVTFWVNGVPVGRDAQAIYAVTWQPPAPGAYEIVPELRYQNGAKTRGAPITVTVAE